MKILGLILTLVAFAHLSFAQTTHPIDEAYNQCMEENASTQGMVECAHVAAEAWDKELNKYYQLLMKVLPAKQKEQLKTAQRAWLTFRDQDQAFSYALYTSFDGTMWRIISADARTERIRQRTLRLISYYDDFQSK